MAKLTLRNVEKYYGKVHAVKGISLEIHDREFLCLLGPSGCGKSTTLRMIAGLETISKGEILIGDRVVNDLAPKDRDVAMVFENYALYPHKNVFENIAYPLRVRKVSAKEIQTQVRKAAKILQIDDLLERSITQLSGGQKQRVAIGRAIVRDPKAFLMDEPISHLDAKLRTHMRGELKHLQRMLNTTMIHVTHDQLEAISMADRIVIMNLGEIQQTGTPDEVFNSPANLFVAGFIGDPAMNFIPCRVEAQGDHHDLVNREVRCPLTAAMAGKLNSKGKYHEEGSLVLGIRPSNVAITMHKPSGFHAVGKVYVTSPLGENMMVEVEVGEQRLRTFLLADSSFEMGKEVWLTFDMERIHLFDKATTKAL